MVGILIIYASYKVAPYFRVAWEKELRWAGKDGFVRYDPATDTLTWGAATDAPGMVSQAGDLIVYWRPDPKYDGFFAAIGLSLRNATKHLSPYFERVEPPAG